MRKVAAIIQNDRVVNTAVCEPGFAAKMGWKMLKASERRVSKGWKHDRAKKKFTAPPDPGPA